MLFQLQVTKSLKQLWLSFYKKLFDISRLFYPRSKRKNSSRAGRPHRLRFCKEEYVSSTQFFYSLAFSFFFLAEPQEPHGEGRGN